MEKEASKFHNVKYIFKEAEETSSFFRRVGTIGILLHQVVQNNSDHTFMKDELPGSDKPRYISQMINGKGINAHPIYLSV